MTKAELIDAAFDAIADHHRHVTKRDVAAALDAAFDAIGRRLSTGPLRDRHVAWPGFGRVEVYRHAGRIVANPRTHEPMVIPPQWKVRLLTAGALREAVNETFQRARERAEAAKEVATDGP